VEALSDLDVLIVDCQTTGASPALGSVLELGWGVVRANLPGVQELQAHWVALPAGHAVPREVRRLTGYREDRCDAVLTPQETWERLRVTMRASASMPAAIHFARFELAFLRDWSQRFAAEAPFPLDAVCVHALACRLYPDLPRRSLRALAGFLGHSVDLTRRAEGHVAATAFIWQRLAGELEQLGVGTWSELNAWLAAPRGPQKRKRRYPMPSAQYRALADQPGVYRFMRCNGDLLYVGKAASLRKRVASHFTAGAATTERALEMLTQVHHIDVTPTATALEAALLENESIKSLRPPYNVQLMVIDGPTWFANATFDAASPTPDMTYPLGPLPSALSVRSLGALIALAKGAEPTRGLRARAVGAADVWAPDEASFVAGFRSFAERHLPAWSDGAPRDGGSSARRAVLTAAKRLLQASKSASLLAEGTDEPTSDAIAAWDPERVNRHIERAAAQSYQVLRRARWLCLLYDSVVAYREPGAEGTRVLMIAGGRLQWARDLEPGEALPAPTVNRPTRERQTRCDRACYDGLRTLVTELKRVRRDRGSIAVRVGRGRLVEGAVLDGLLCWV